MTSEAKALAKKFGEEPESFSWEEFFGMLVSFNENFEVPTISLKFPKNFIP
jgi:hypothetical protein